MGTMHKVQSNRIIDLGGKPGYVYAVISDILGEVPINYLNLRNLTEEGVISRIDSPQSYYIVDNVSSKWVLSSIIHYYDSIWAFNTELNRYEINMSTSLLSVGVSLGDLIYGVNSNISSWQTRMLIAALNNGLIDRISVKKDDMSVYIEQYLAQSHANPRALARGLYDGWIALQKRESSFLLAEPLEIIVQAPLWLSVLSE